MLSGQFDASTSQKALGEVLSSSVTGLVAQSWQTLDAQGMPGVTKPRFGSYLTVDCLESSIKVYAVLYNVITGPQDNVHKPFALGMSRERLKVEQPHIFSLLRTELHAVIIGYREAGFIHQYLPPYPPDVHDFVYETTASEILELTEGFEYLRLLTTVASVPADELLAAAIREAYRARNEDYDFLVAAGQALSNLLRSDYDRLMCVLQKIRPTVRMPSPPSGST
jgi:hypothetical protein